MVSIEHNKTSAARWLVGVFFMAALAAADQWAKARIARIFENHAFAFSLPLPPWLMYLIYAGVLGYAAYYLIKNHQTLFWMQALAWGLILAGALENVIERLVLGYVRDFIYLTAGRFTGIYNLADFYILAGIALLLLPYKSGQNHQE